MIKHHKLSTGWAVLAGICGIPLLMVGAWLIHTYIAIVFSYLFYGVVTNFGMFILCLVKSGVVTGWFVSRYLAMNLSME